jgi:pSer/pThr/pTyr-binding forkhead associated (FHA) protein
MDLALLVLGGRNAGQEIAVRRAPFVIGRDKQCHLRLRCTLVSRRHCAIAIQDGRILIDDLRSTNGTFLNGEEVGVPQELHHGDRLNIGTFEFQVRALETADGENPADSGHPETISNMSSAAATNHGAVTGREIGLDLLKLDTTVASKSAAKAKKPARQADNRGNGNLAGFDSIVVCSEDTSSRLE